MSAHRVLTARATWLTPAFLIVGLAAVLPSIYLAGTVDPQGHLRDLPVGLVVEHQTVTAEPAAAEGIARAIEAQSGDALAITRMSADELATAMAEDRVAGAVVIPEDFDASVTAEPTVSILTNAGDGGLSSGLVVGNLTPTLRGIAAQSQDFEIVSAPYEPLPDHAGLGMSAFYYALVLVLLGFIGASVVNPLVDAALGFLPSEIGPLVERRRYTALSRRTTYLGKVAILVATAPVAAAVVQLVAAAFGVAVDDPVVLWLYSAAVISAIGTSALAVFAIAGPGIGALVNTIFFIALAMVSSGGTVPVAATPQAFHWFSVISPYRHVVDGTRSLFYFDGNLAAGLSSAWITVAAGGTVGLLLGVGVTTAYARVPRFSRHPRELLAP